MKRNVQLTLTLCFSVLLLHAQEDFHSDISKPDYHPASPDAAALGRYGQYNVSLNTGTPEISIPIYTIKVGDFTFPVSISYHASGIKVTDVASRVGLGWSLNAGGVISQNAMGILDGYQSMLNVPQSFNPDCGINNCTTNADYLLAKDIIDSRIYDTEPDLFTYNFLGFAGKYVQTNAGIATLPYSSEITFGDDIIDKKGNRYIFGESETSTVIRTCTSYSKNPLSSGPTAYYLTKVITAMGDTIQLVYEHEIYSYFQSTSSKKYFRNTSAPGTDSSCELPADMSCRDRNSVNAPRLTQIIAPNGVIINFTYTQVRDDLETSSGQYQAKALNSITVTDGGSTSFVYTFEYAVKGTQLGTDGKAATGKRLYLTKFTDKDNGVYAFQYYNWESLPPRDSFSVDHWGYYNGKTNTTLVPSLSLMSFAGADRSVAEFSGLTYGTLQQITYPTKGYTVFDYEGHRPDASGSGYIGGGLRIKTISNYDINSALLTQKKYAYYSGINAGLSDENMVLTYNSDVLIQRKAIEGGGYADTGTARCEFLVLSSTTNPIMAGVDFNSNFQYGKVEVTDYTDALAGKSVFYYSVLDFGTGFPVPQSDGRMEVKLSKEEHYRYNTSTSAYDAQPLTKKEYTYAVLSDNVSQFTNLGEVDNYDQVVGFRIKYDIPEQPGGVAKFSYYHYKYTSIWYYLQTLVETTNDGTNSSVTTTQFAYEKPHAQLTKTTMTNSSGDEMKRVIRYPQDYSTGGIETPSGPSGSIHQEQYRGLPVEDLIFVNDKLVSGQLNKSVLENGFLRMDKKYTMDLSTPTTNSSYPSSNTTSFSLLTGSPYREYFSVVDKDAKGNPIEVLSNGKFRQAMIWDSKKREVLAICENAKYSDIAYTNFDNANKGSWSYTLSSGTGLFGSTGYSSSSGISRSSLDPNVEYKVSLWANGDTGHTPSISYTPSTNTNKLKIFDAGNGWKLYEWVVAKGITSITVSTGGGTTVIDNLRLSPSTSKVITFSYKPLLGLVSKTDPANRSEYYSYDAAGRLTMIQDDYKNVLKTFKYHYIEDIH
ncbi:hypothetical protein WSM22_40060 [Cytophagales bacterium WSM2-2]|nr:hypothetical protein WSM22_40060 [Cytophagales bacterium WSM2-2]